MDIVERPELPPGQCIACLQNDDPLGFFDTLLTPSLAGDDRIYVSVSWVLERATQLGWRSGDEFVELERELELERDARALAEDDLARADAVVDAIDLIESRDFRARKKPGRPRKAAHDDLEAA